MFEPPATDADIIILAGDIGKVANGIHWARRTFSDKEIVYVIGNHEYYGTQRAETLAMLHIAARATGVHLLDDAELLPQQHHLRILGCTLWTDFCLFSEFTQNAAMQAGLHGLNDFCLIQEGRLGTFTPAQSVGLHKKSLAWLKSKLDEPFDGKTVVVTHHLPSEQSVVERYKSELLAACFASELDYLFGKMDLWIHGHTHDNLDYESNGTRVICNPRGYVTMSGMENFNFDPGLVIEI